LGKIVVTEYVTLDGVVEDNGGIEGFERGGWQFQFDPGKKGEAFNLPEMRDSAALLLGRVTYDVFARWWPSQEGELADLLNALPKYVVSSTIENPGWNIRAQGRPG
jgi:dihydrofolate reductase